MWKRRIQVDGSTLVACASRAVNRSKASTGAPRVNDLLSIKLINGQFCEWEHTGHCFNRVWAGMSVLTRSSWTLILASATITWFCLYTVVKGTYNKPPLIKWVTTTRKNAFEAWSRLCIIYCTSFLESQSIGRPPELDKHISYSRCAFSLVIEQLALPSRPTIQFRLQRYA